LIGLWVGRVYVVEMVAYVELVIAVVAVLL